MSDIMMNISYFGMSFLDPYLMFLTAAGVFFGIYVGAIPGLSVTMAVSILISFTFKWGVNEALALIAGIYYGGVYGGSRSAILINVPGAPAAIASALDGYPLAKMGEAGQAIGLTTIMGVFGGVIGVICLAVGAPMLSQLALSFAPRDYMMLAIWGLLLIGSLSGGMMAKGIFAGALGVLFGTMGLDPLTAEPRFTFGLVQLTAGAPYVAAMIGLFGVSEVLVQLHELHFPTVKQQVDKLFPPWKLIRKHLPLASRCSLLGVVIGALPGAGGDIAALMAYDHAKRSTKNPERPFGEGAWEGIVAPEAAAVGSVGGCYIPMLTLGIPGDAVTAVIIGALYIHGLRPGPMMLIETPHLFWFTVGNVLQSCIWLGIFGFMGIKLFAKIVEIPKSALLPMIVVLSAVGAYAIENNPVHIYWMLGFGVCGYFLKMYGFQVGPVILGIILGPLLDNNYRRAMISAGQSPLQFVSEFFTSPVSLVLLILLTLTVLSQTRYWAKLTGLLRRRSA